MTAKHLALFVIASLVAWACGTGGGLSKKDVFAFYAPVNELDQEIKAADDQGASVLAPTSTEKAKEYLEAAIDAGRNGEKAEAEAEAAMGLEIMNDIRSHMEKAREVMKEVLATRARAENEGAPDMYPEEFEELDEQFKKASIYIEKGKVDKAREMRKELVTSYSDLELKALKTGTVEAAKAAIAEARKKGAEDWAPKTLKLALEEIKLVVAVLESDRTQTDKANAHARKTIWLAGRATAISHLARSFDNDDLTLEQILLWYQAQLEMVNEPLGGTLPFDKTNEDMVAVFKDTIESVVKALSDARGLLNDQQTQIAALNESMKKQKAEDDQIITTLLNANRKQLVKLKKKYAYKLSKEGKAAAAADEREMEVKAHFKEIDQMFDKYEAIVNMKGQKITIAAHGFRFSSGSTNLEARNFGLLNKVVAAMGKFPGCHLTISGHTDSRGNNHRNLMLSKERAENVATFFTEVAHINKARIEYNGYGESRPVANNETKEGRALNRRIEFMITIP